MARAPKRQSRFWLVVDPLLVVCGLLVLIYDPTVTARSFWIGAGNGWLLARWFGRMSDYVAERA